MVRTVSKYFIGTKATHGKRVNSIIIFSQPGTSQSIDDDYDHEDAYDDNGDDNDDPHQVLQVKAVDGDRGIGNPITYSITGGPDHLFAVNKLNGLVYVNVRLVLL